MIVLDTHALIWLIEGDPRLGVRARERIDHARGGSVALVPAMCAWDIALLHGRGKIGLSLDPRRWIDIMLATPGMGCAPLSAHIAIRAAELAWEHRDPADRMIVATAIEHDAVLLTADEGILSYAAAGHVKAVDARL